MYTSDSVRAFSTPTTCTTMSNSNQRNPNENEVLQNMQMEFEEYVTYPRKV